MNLFRSLFVLSLVLASNLWAAPLGVVQSKGSFELTKSASEKTLEVSGMGVVDESDRVVAREELVQVSFADGDTLLVDRGSAASFTSDGTVLLEKGNMMAGTKSGVSRSYAYEGLVVEPVPGSDMASEEQGILLMSSQDADTVNVAAMNGGFAVLSANRQERLAYLGNGDAMQFRRVDDVWVLQSQQGLQSPFVASDEVVEGELNYDIEKGVVLWWSYPVAAGAGVAGYFIYQANQDGGNGSDDDDDDDQREPFSPIAR